jgi:hypothetical protein
VGRRSKGTPAQESAGARGKPHPGLAAIPIRDHAERESAFNRGRRAPPASARKRRHGVHFGPRHEQDGAVTVVRRERVDEQLEPTASAKVDEIQRSATQELVIAVDDPQAEIAHIRQAINAPLPG